MNGRDERADGGRAGGNFLFFRGGSGKPRDMLFWAVGGTFLLFCGGAANRALSGARAGPQARQALLLWHYKSLFQSNIILKKEAAA